MCSRIAKLLSVGYMCRPLECNWLLLLVLKRNLLLVQLDAIVDGSAHVVEAAGDDLAHQARRIAVALVREEPRSELSVRLSRWITARECANRCILRVERKKEDRLSE